MCCCQLDVISTLLMTVQFENITIDICYCLGVFSFVCISFQVVAFIPFLGVSHGVLPIVRRPISPTAHQSDNPIVRQPISPTTYKCKSIPSLINIFQGIPTDHEGGSYIHVPYITRVFFANHTGHEFAEMCPLTRDFSITRRVPGIR